LSGGELSDSLEKVGITVNKNAIPNDSRKPWDPSGIRIGTPAITTRGMKTTDMAQIAEYIDMAVKNRQDQSKLAEIKEQVKKFMSAFPIPGIKFKK